jgi:hypothetical protein
MPPVSPQIGKVMRNDAVPEGDRAFMWADRQQTFHRRMPRSAWLGHSGLGRFAQDGGELRPKISQGEWLLEKPGQLQLLHSRRD